MSNKNIIPIFVPHLGCPHDCVFCNQNKIAGLKDISVENERKTIQEYLSYFKNKNDIQIAFYGGSFTAIDYNLQNTLLKVAYEYIENGLVKSIRLSTRPDSINEKILNNLKKYGVKTIELGVQSLNEEVLISSGRGHNVQCVYDSSKLIKDFGLELGLQQMIGLPRDTEERAIETAKKFVEIGPNIVRIYPTLVVEDTYLEKLYISGKYKPLTLEEAVDLSAKLLKIYNRNNINVIRIGLQPTEEINYNGSIVAGPFHPAFRQLVENKIIIDKILKTLENKKIRNLEIFSNNKNISTIAGQNKSGSKKLYKDLKLKSLKFVDNKSNDIILFDRDSLEKINLLDW